jgi:cytochrome c
MSMPMDTFEFNKIVMAILLALIILKAGGIIADQLVHPVYLAKNVYIVPGVAQKGTTETAGTEEKLEPIEPLLAEANIENGKKIAKQCLQCHSFDKGGPNKVGPDLWNITARGIAKNTGYAYSSALKKKEGQWTPDALNAFLYKPTKDVPGTKMSFAGLKKGEDRRDVIAYLLTLKD